MSAFSRSTDCRSPFSSSLSTSLFFSYSSTFNLPLHFSHHVSLSEFYKDLKWDISRFQLTPVPDKNLCWQSQRKGDGVIFSKRKSSDSKQKWWCDQFQKISRFAAAGFGEQEHHLRRSGWKLRSTDFTAKNQVNKSWNFFVHIAQVSLAPTPVSP